MFDDHTVTPTDDSASAPSLDLIHEGWQHLQLQRPLAAWASWQRALRVDPENAAAIQALATLETAEELPAAARAVYRFRTPADAAGRARWDARLRSGGLDELDAAAEVFAALVRDDPGDADAWHNLALCHAWLGRNADAVACLDRVVALLAAVDPERASDAWTLAEVVRLGAGAEPLADDFSYAWVIDAPPSDLIDAWPNLVPVQVPDDPVTGEPLLHDGRVFEWLDRLPPGPTSAPPRVEDLPRVLAAVVRTPARLRLSTPDPSGFASLDDRRYEAVRAALANARGEKRPLPLAWADAALSTFRTPPGLDAPARADLARAVIEHYYENLWVVPPRESLGGVSPLEAARRAADGDPVALARLSGLVRFREQLGSRPTHAAVYQGYPFDRLRRRLGLAASVEGSVDADDLSCASGAELDRLDPTALDDTRLADAFASSDALRNDARTARFAAELVRRGGAALGRLDPPAVVAPLVRQSLEAGDPEAALGWLDRWKDHVPAAQAQTLTVWSAELHARSGRPDAALAAYQSLLGTSDAGAELALDGAETLLDNGHPEQALPLLREAQVRARSAGDRAMERAAARLLGTVRDT